MVPAIDSSPGRHVLVAVDRPALVLPPALTYRVPAAMTTPPPGSLVRVPLARAETVGVVLGGAPPPRGLGIVRDIIAVATPLFRIPADVMALAQWVADFYLCGIGQALAAASFVGLQDLTLPRSHAVQLAPDAAGRARGTRDEPLIARLAEALREAPAPNRRWLAEAAGVSPAVVDRLFRAGFLQTAEAAPRPITHRERDTPHQLNGDQQRALDAVLAAVHEPRFEAFLLHGITGSGKTEVFLRAISEVLASGRTALVLVPEISLTPQTVERFERRFGEPVGLCHSQLSRRDKLALALHLRERRIRIVIGARSAVFAPLPDIGIVVVDEEHDGSYKQGSAPMYHGRDVAVMRARMAGIPVLLASATPSLESYENARQGKYRLLELRERPAGAELPAVRVVDLGTETRRRAADGLPGLLSPTLIEAIRGRLDRGEQSLLLLNRRGFSSFLCCPACHWVAKCADDDIAMTVHRRDGGRGASEEDLQLDLFTPARVLQDGELRCHFCGTRAPIPRTCPQCADAGLVAMGSGTQRVELELAEAFPGVRLLRMDHDTAGTRASFAAAWEQMRSGEAAIILGTQMIAKGLHLDRVTLVGVVLADIGLFVPDFRAEERTFALLCQVAGRSGRSAPGEVLLQTFMPRHDAIILAQQHDYAGFFERERRRREALRFPPVQRLVALTLSDDDAARARERAAALAAILRRLASTGTYDGAAVRGPLPAPLARLGGRWRERILLRGPRPLALGRLYRDAVADAEWRLPPTARLIADVDPQDLL